MEEPRDRLGKLLDRYEKRREDQERKQAEEQAAARALVQDQERFINENIRPRVGDYAETLKQRGHTASVTGETGICTIRFSPKDVESIAEGPFLTFSASTDQIVVMGTVARGVGTGAHRASIARDAFRPEMVDEAIVSWLDEVLFGSWQ